MLLKDRKNQPWIAACSLLLFAAVAWYAFDCVQAGRLLGGRSRPGFWFGIVGGGICGFEMLLWPRKALRRWGQTFRLGWTQVWMRAHVWLGMLSLPLLLMHCGIYRWGGLLSSLLMTLFLAAIASGIWGLAMQQILPRRMFAEVPAEKIVYHIDFVRAQLRDEAARLVLATCGAPAELLGRGVARSPDGHSLVAGITVPGKARRAAAGITAEPVPDSGPLLELFRDHVAPYLCPDALYARYADENRQWSDSYRHSPARDSRRSPLGDAASAALTFEAVKLRLNPDAHEAVDRLAQLCDQRRQFEKQARLHALLQNWMAVHLPLAVVVMILMVVHAIVALRYL
jgi:hypothetical protein